MGLLQTRGFGDTLSIMRGFKSLGLDEDEVKNFRSMVKQQLVVPKRLTQEVSERVNYRGRVVQPLDEADVRRAVRELRDQGEPRCSPCRCCGRSRTTSTSAAWGRRGRGAPGALYTLSSDLLPRLGEYRRTVTTALNAEPAAGSAHALRSLQTRLRDTG